MTEDRIRDLLAEAVERQLEEQRALRQSLELLVVAIEKLSEETKTSTTLTLDTVRAGSGAALEVAHAGAASAVQIAETTSKNALDLTAQSSQNADDRVGKLAELLVEGLRDLAATQQKAIELSAEKSRRMFRDAARAILVRVKGINQQMVESDQLTERLRSQTTSLDGIVNRIDSAPDKIDAVIGQALRRALTVRATITEHSKDALDEVFEPLKREVKLLAGAVDGESIANAIEELANRQASVENAIERLAEATSTRISRLGAPKSKAKSSRAAR